MIAPLPPRAPALLSALGATLLLAACSGAGPKATRSYAESPYRPGHPSYRVGAPYEVNGVWYYPKVDYDYDRTGTASWYGPQFDRRLTANGEVFDMNELSAAHKTLPLPSVVEVTNLQNGRRLDLRVNDRGPFVGDRLIDVSRRAAQLLGFETAGTAPVRVRVLKDQSIAVAEAAMRGETGPVLLAAAPQTALPAAAPPPPTFRAAPRPAETAPIRVARAPAALPPPEAPPARIAAAPAAPPPEPAPVRVAAAAVVKPLAPIADRLAAPPEAPPARIAAAPAAPPRRTVASRIEAALFPPASAAPFERRPAPPPRLPYLVAARPGARIFVQAGAFSVKDNAERVQSRIARLGAVQVTSASVNGIEVYRVRLGPVASIDEANQLLARVVDSGYTAARIVND